MLCQKSCARNFMLSGVEAGTLVSRLLPRKLPRQVDILEVELLA